MNGVLLNLELVQCMLCKTTNAVLINIFLKELRMCPDCLLNMMHIDESMRSINGRAKE